MRADGSGDRLKGWTAAAGAAAVFAASRVAAAAGLEHFSTWSYQWSWYPFLLAVDGVTAGLTGRFALLSRPRFAASLWLWSVPLWFSFELLNLRLANWFYVGLPASALERHVGSFLAFATVLPAIWLPLRVLERAGLARTLRGPSFRVGRGVRRGLVGAGVVFLALPLAWPEQFYPLVWGAPALMLAPWNHARDPETSLLGRVAAGRYGRLVQLLAAGLAAGVAWEAMNWFAGGRWIYTVPGLEEVKLFEMPVAGFLGFPAFAVECAVVYRALVNARVAVPEEGGRVSGGRTAAAAISALAFSVAVAVGMDRWTVASSDPVLGDLPGLDPTAVERLREAGIADPGVLMAADSAALSRRLGVEPGRAGDWVRAATLAELRSLGAPGARALWEAGIRGPCQVARAGEERLVRVLEPAGVLGPPPAHGRRTRVWLGAARAACAGAGPSPARDHDPTGGRTSPAERRWMES